MGKKQYKKLTPELMKEIVGYTVETHNEEIEKERKRQYNKKLRNTKLLLKNYRQIVNHSKNAIFEAAQIEDEVFSDVLEAMGSSGGEYYIKSIRASAIRTRLMIEHINAMLEIYRKYCEQSDSVEDIRRLKVIDGLYIKEPAQTAKQIAEAENVDIRTIYRDVNIAIEKITFLLFGIDGLPQ